MLVKSGIIVELAILTN